MKNNLPTGENQLAPLREMRVTKGPLTFADIAIGDMFRSAGAVYTKVSRHGAKAWPERLGGDPVPFAQDELVSPH